MPGIRRGFIKVHNLLCLGKLPQKGHKVSPFLREINFLSFFYRVDIAFYFLCKKGKLFFG
jgi:hypothetical protein